MSMNKAASLTGQESRDLLLRLAQKIQNHESRLEKDTVELLGLVSQISELQSAESELSIQHLPPWVKACCILRGAQHGFWLALEADPSKITKDADTQIALIFAGAGASASNSCLVRSWCLKAAEHAEKADALIGQERISGVIKIVTLPAAGDAVLKIETSFS